MQVSATSSAFAALPCLWAQIIDVDFYIVESSLSAVRQKSYDVAAWLQVERDERGQPVPQPIIFDDDDEKRYMGYVTGAISSSEIQRLAGCHVQFFCPMPFAESITEDTTTRIDDNEGTVATPPVITITVATANFYFHPAFYVPALDTSFEHGVRVTLGDYHLLLLNEDDFDPGDVIVFDKPKRLVTVNNVDRRQYLAYTSRWFDIPPGPFEIVKVPATGVTLEVKYRERWI